MDTLTKVAVLSRDVIVQEDRFPDEDELVELCNYSPPLVVEGEAMEKKRSVSAKNIGSTRSVPAPKDPAETFHKETEQEEISRHQPALSEEQLEAFKHYPERPDVSINDIDSLEGYRKMYSPVIRAMKRRPPLLYSVEANIASAFAMLDATEMEPSTVHQTLSGNELFGLARRN